MNRIVRDLILIFLILIMPMCLMELLEIDVSLQKIMTESEERNDRSKEGRNHKKSLL